MVVPPRITSAAAAAGSAIAAPAASASRMIPPLTPVAHAPCVAISSTRRVIGFRRARATAVPSSAMHHAHQSGHVQRCDGHDDDERDTTSPAATTRGNVAGLRMLSTMSTSAAHIARNRKIERMATKIASGNTACRSLSRAVDAPRRGGRQRAAEGGNRASSARSPAALARRLTAAG